MAREILDRIRESARAEPCGALLERCRLYYCTPTPGTRGEEEEEVLRIVREHLRHLREDDMAR